MTGLLTDLMRERADDLTAPDLDLAGIAREGERRVRRRRTTLAAGLAAAAAVAAVAVPAVVDDDPARQDLVADGTTADPRQLAWITGSTLHRPGQPDVDLGVDVRAWVWAGDDIVLTDTDRRVRLWDGSTLDDLGPAATTGSDLPELVSDGTSVAWVSVDERLVRYDVGDRTLVVAPELPGDEPQVTAVGGADVYAVDSEGVYAWKESAPHTFETLTSDPDRAVLDVESGTTVQLVDERSARVSAPGRDVTLPVDGFANLSPDGSQLMAESDDEGVLVDTATGGRLTLETGHAWSLPYQWLDDTTVVVLAFDGADEGDGVDGARAYLQACDTVTGACDGLGTEVPSGYGDFQLPLGLHLAK